MSNKVAKLTEAKESELSSIKGICLDIDDTLSTEGKLKPFNGWTNKFIFPPYEFSIADAMVTNLHMPMSTLLMQVYAFGGYDLVMKAYKEAIKEKYKFYSYGDAMLII